jgi:hypothetical protein
MPSSPTRIQTNLRSHLTGIQTTLLTLGLAGLLTATVPSKLVQPYSHKNFKNRLAYFQGFADHISAMSDEANSHKSKYMLLSIAKAQAKLATDLAETDGEYEETYDLADSIDNKLDYSLQRLPETKAALTLTYNKLISKLQSIPKRHWRIETPTNLHQIRLYLRDEFEKSFRPMDLEVRVDRKGGQGVIVPKIDEPGPYSSGRTVHRGPVINFVEDIRKYLLLD